MTTGTSHPCSGTGAEKRRAKEKEKEIEEEEEEETETETETETQTETETETQKEMGGGAKKKCLQCYAGDELKVPQPNGNALDKARGRRCFSRTRREGRRQFERQFGCSLRQTSVDVLA